MNQKKIDIITILGIVVSLGGLGLGYYLEGGNFSALFGISSLFIIYGGTLGATLTTMSREDIKAVPKTIKKVFSDEEYDYLAIIEDFKKWSEVSRRDGIVALGEIADEIEDPFTKRGIEYILEGNDYEVVKEMLEKDIESMMDRHHNGASTYAKAGGFAPTMGIVGAVMGLIVVLGMLGSSDVGQLGHGIAVAFTATLLGVGTANVVFIPFAEKLKMRSNNEVTYKIIVMEGVLGIQAGKNPTQLKNMLLTYLPESQRNATPPKKGSDNE